MNEATDYFYSVLLLGIGLFFLTYVLYGRITHRPLIGVYKPGMPGYDVFRKLVDSTKNLVIVIAATLIFAVIAINSARRILQSGSPRSILVGAPVMVVLGFAVLIPLITKVLVQKK